MSFYCVMICIDNICSTKTVARKNLTYFVPLHLRNQKPRKMLCFHRFFRIIFDNTHLNLDHWLVGLCFAVVFLCFLIDISLQVVREIDHQTDIVYNSTGEAGGGMVASRYVQ